MKQSSTSLIVMSDAERRETPQPDLRRVSCSFRPASDPAVVFGRGRGKQHLSSPVDIWNRFLLLMEKPIKQLNLFGHIWASLLRVFIALAFAWLLGISFGILIGWNKKANALLGPSLPPFALCRPWPGCH